MAWFAQARERNGTYESALLNPGVILGMLTFTAKGTGDGVAPYQLVASLSYWLGDNECGGLVFKSGEGALETATGTKVYSRRETCPMVARYRGSDKK